MHNKFNMGWLVVPFTLLCWISLASAQSTKLAVGYSGISADRFVEEFDKSGYIDSLYGRKK